MAKEQALKRTAMLSTRTTEAGARQFRVWCARRRLHHTAVMRDAMVEYMKRHENDIPEVQGAE